MIYSDVSHFKGGNDFNYGPQMPAREMTGSLGMVATSGAFDILTPGHIRLFQVMRSLGNMTVVLLNTDASIKSYKSPQRPVKPWEDRATILNALETVDVVIGFDEDDPIEAIKKLRPKIWVKGNRPHDVLVELETIWAYGGTYVSAWTPLEQSTTAYIAKIQASGISTETKYEYGDLLNLVKRFRSLLIYNGWTWERVMDIWNEEIDKEKG